MKKEVTEIIVDQIKKKLLVRTGPESKAKTGLHQAVFVDGDFHLSITEAARVVGINTPTLHSQLNRGTGCTNDLRCRLATREELTKMFPDVPVNVIADPEASGTGCLVTTFGGRVYVKRPGKTQTRPVLLDNILYFSISEAAEIVNRSAGYISSCADFGGVVDGVLLKWPSVEDIVKIIPDARVVDGAAGGWDYWAAGSSAAGEIGNDSSDGLEPRLSKFIDVKGRDFVGIIDGNGGVSVFPISDDGREMYSEMKFWASRGQVPKIISKTIILVRI